MAMLLHPFVINAFLLDDSVHCMGDAVLEPWYRFLQDVSMLSRTKPTILYWLAL
jgi:hypothetical protein